MPYTIYLRTNLVNGKQYVGQTRNFKQREYKRELGLKRTSIKDCCNGGRFMNYKGERKWYNCNQHGGYIWRFEEKMLSEQVA